MPLSVATIHASRFLFTVIEASVDPTVSPTSVRAVT
jgi:hypothetical protein